MNDFLVSILIPCHNAEKWLVEAIESALNQTWQNIEVIIVDDGSTDRSLEIAQKYKGEKLKLITQIRKGASTARNLAFEHSRGDFIQYLDADDILDSHKITNQMLLYKNNHFNKQILTSASWIRFVDQYKNLKANPEVLWKDFLPVDWLVASWTSGKMMHPAAWLTPRDLIIKAGKWNENLSLNDDGEFFTRVILESEKILFCKDAISYYRSNIPTSLSNTKSNSAYESLYNSIDYSVQALLNKLDNEHTKKASAYAYQRFIYEAYPKVPNLVQLASNKVKELGGCDLKIEGGELFNIIARIFGWKCAKIIRDLNRK
jgi:glycosyltransferase involved in cell wall biosynthesis